MGLMLAMDGKCTISMVYLERRCIVCIYLEEHLYQGRARKYTGFWSRVQVVYARSMFVVLLVGALGLMAAVAQVSLFVQTKDDRCTNPARKKHHPSE